MENSRLLTLCCQNHVDPAYCMQYWLGKLKGNLKRRFLNFSTFVPLFHPSLVRNSSLTLILFQIRNHVLELLLDYYCNPLVQFKGRSAIDVAMTKSLDLLDIFIKSPTTNLNAPINDHNQTVLVKMFSLPFFKTMAPSERLQTVCDISCYGFFKLCFEY